MNWNDLDMYERALLIKIFVDGGMTDLGLMRSFYNDYAKGGGIHIKPENRGKFNATKKRTGKTTEELTHSSNPITRKRAIFALNARKWHHKDDGGFLGSLVPPVPRFHDIYISFDPLFAWGGPLPKPFSYQQIPAVRYEDGGPIGYNKALQLILSNNIDNIKMVLRQLADNGYYDLDWNKMSRSQIEGIQRKIGAKVDGIVGNETRTKWRNYNVDGKVGSRTSLAFEKAYSNERYLQNRAAPWEFATPDTVLAPIAARQEQIKRDNQRAKVIDTSKVKALYRSVDKNIGKRLFYDDESLKTANEELGKEGALNEQYRKKWCAEASYDYFYSKVAPTLGIAGHRDYLNYVPISKYDIPSKEKLSAPDEEARLNSSLDSWELGKAITGTGIGKRLDINNDNEIMNMPVGTLLLFNSELNGQQFNPYIPGQDQSLPRHTATIVGYDRNTGDPIVFEKGFGDGQVYRLDKERLNQMRKGIKTGTRGNKFDEHLSDALVLNGYQNLTREELQKRYDKAVTNAYKPMSQTITSKSDTANKLLNLSKDTERRFNQYNIDNGINQNLRDEIAKTALAVIGHESHYAGSLDVEGVDKMEPLRVAKSRIADSPLYPGIMAAKMIYQGVGTVENAVKNVKNWTENLITKEEREEEPIDNRQQYQIEMELYNKIKKENPGISEEELTEMVNEQLPKSRGRSDYMSKVSKGIGQMKEKPLAFINYFGEDAKITSGKDRHQNAMMATYVYLTENFKDAKRRYKGISDKDALRLAVVSYNNNTKFKDPEFYDFYIKNNRMSDMYLDSVNEFQNALYGND